MLDGEDLERMLVEVTVGKPHTVKGAEAEALYAKIQQEVDDIVARGNQVAIPSEWGSSASPMAPEAPTGDDDDDDDIVNLGGPGSGHHGHAGVPGQSRGLAPGEGGARGDTTAVRRKPAGFRPNSARRRMRQ